MEVRGQFVAGSFLIVGSREQTQVTKLGSKCIYLLSQLAGPHVHYFKTEEGEEEGAKSFPSSYLPEMRWYHLGICSVEISVFSTYSFLSHFFPFFLLFNFTAQAGLVLAIPLLSRVNYRPAPPSQLLIEGR